MDNRSYQLAHYTVLGSASYDNITANKYNMKTTLITKRNRAFTLLELLVSMVVTIVVIGVMLLATRAGFTALEDGRSDVSATQKAQVALSQLTSDLESMVVHRGNGFEWFVAKTENSTAVTEGSFTSYFSNMAFFSVPLDRYDGDYVNDDTLLGDMTPVRYGIRFINVLNGENNSNRKMVLYRQIVDPDDAFGDSNTRAYVGRYAEEALRVRPAPADRTADFGLIGAFEDLAPRLEDSNNIVTDNIRELTVNFTIEYTNELDEIQIIRVPIIDLDVDNVPNVWNDFSIQGNGIYLDHEDQDFIRFGKIVSIEVNAQILSEDADGFLSIENNQPKGAIEKEITRFSKIIHIPQLN